VSHQFKQKNKEKTTIKEEFQPRFLFFMKDKIHSTK